jgi:ABC-type nickel/cobalt efflux system permease component RcnA
MLALCLGSYLIVTMIATLFLWSALHTARQADRRQYRLVRQLKSMPYDDTEA